MNPLFGHDRTTDSCFISIDKTFYHQWKNVLALVINPTRRIRKSEDIRTFMNEQ